MPRNGSGVMTPDVDFATEAASPPIEISKLDQVLDDIADELTNSLAADGQTNPTADITLNGHKLTNLGAATALTDAPRVTEIIDQDLIYYVDTGAADAYVITPSPAIAAYEEGQRFVWRSTHTNTTTSTLNVNGLGPIVIQTNDGGALVAGAIVTGGYYEVTYDANTTPDRWVMTSPASKVPDATLSANVALRNVDNAFSADQTVSHSGNSIITVTSTTGTVSSLLQSVASTGGLVGTSTNHPFSIYTNSIERYAVSAAGNHDFKAGTVTTNNTSASEVGYKGAPSRNVTSSTNTAATDAGGTIRFTSGSGQTFTLDSDPPPDSIVALRNTSGSDWTIAASGTLTLAGAGTGSRTLATTGMASAQHDGSGNWCISGAGLS